MSDELIHLENVTAGHKGNPVLRGLDLTVNPGEVVALLGPNGAGKTTTLLTISGLLPAISGRVMVLGEPVDTLRPWVQARRGIVHVPDDRSVFSGLTVRENLRVGCANHANTVAEVVSFFPALEPLLDRRGGLLSGGEQQMVAIGRGIAQNPKVLMVDELSLGLAPMIAKSLMPVVRRVAAERGVGVLLVEQHVQLALEVADRAYVLSHGELRYEGSAAKLASDRELLEHCYLGTVTV